MAATMLAPTLGPIEPNILYPLDSLMALSGLGKTAFRSMRREGLKVKYAAGRAYVKGEWFIDHVEAHGKDSK